MRTSSRPCSWWPSTNSHNYTSHNSTPDQVCAPLSDMHRVCLVSLFLSLCHILMCQRVSLDFFNLQDHI